MARSQWGNADIFVQIPGKNRKKDLGWPLPNSGLLQQLSHFITQFFGVGHDALRNNILLSGWNVNLATRKNYSTADYRPTVRTWDVQGAHGEHAPICWALLGLKNHGLLGGRLRWGGKELLIVDRLWTMNYCGCFNLRIHTTKIHKV